jgi:hypothetical protein
MNGLRNVALLAGATADTQLAACFAEIPNGGICDARMYGNSIQTIASTVTFGDGVHSFTLVCDPQTKFIPSSASLVMFQAKAGTKISGCSFDTTAQTFTGTVLQYGSLGHVSDTGPVQQFPPDGYGTNVQTVLENVTVQGNWADTGHAIDILASSKYDSFAAWIQVSNILVNGLVCLNLQTAGTG